MLRILLAFMIATAVALPGRAQEEKAKVDKEIENLIAGRPAALKANDFKDKSEVALVIAKWIPELGLRAKQAEQPGKVSLWALQGDLLARSLYFEEQAIHGAKREDGRSTNTQLMDQYVQLLCRDDICTGSFKNGIAQALNKFYPPKDLDKHAAKIEKALELARMYDGRVQSEVLLLYGSIPSIPDNRARAFVQALPRPSISDEKMSLAGQFVSTNSSLFLDRVLARRGDKEAEKRIIEGFASLQEIGASWDIAEAIAYVDIPQVRKAIVEGLRSEQEIAMIGGGTYLKRDLCAEVLMKMMRDDPSFPIKEGKMGFSDENMRLDAIEKWCAEHWGRSFPKEPRKQIRTKIRIAP